MAKSPFHDPGWASDTSISMPQPVDQDVPAEVDLGGFGFNSNGLLHNITSEQIEALFTPRYGPHPRGVEGT